MLIEQGGACCPGLPWAQGTAGAGPCLQPGVQFVGWEDVGWDGELPAKHAMVPGEPRVAQQGPEGAPP